MEFESKYAAVQPILYQNRCLFIAEDITKELASSLCGSLIYLNSINAQEDIKIFIHTQGGDAAALSSIYDVMSLITAPISTIGVGKIYSAGAFILAAGTKGKRCMFKNAEVMIHGLQCLFPELPISDQIDSTIYYNYLESFNKRILKILSKHTKQSITKISNDSKRDLYLDAPAALKYGIIDQIL